MAVLKNTRCNIVSLTGILSLNASLRIDLQTISGLSIRDNTNRNFSYRCGSFAVLFWKTIMPQL